MKVEQSTSQNDNRRIEHVNVCLVRIDGGFVSPPNSYSLLSLILSI
jgi:hypothetical protein